jgi:tetratricopeptide (TPR) repeat protein
MEIQDQIKLQLKEAELYRTQGLLVEAKDKYLQVVDTINKLKHLDNKERLVAKVIQKVSEMESSFLKIEKARTNPNMSSRDQDLIKKLFSFSQDQDEDAMALEGAITLAKFGQFDRAIMDFNELIKKDALRVVASKNILRCHIAKSTIEDAITQYRQWLDSDLFAYDDLQKIRVFLENHINKKGLVVTIPQAQAPSEQSAAKVEQNDSDEDFLDISSIGITFDSGPHKGETVELEVSFQTGNLISILVSSKDKDLIDNLKVGFRLNSVQFYSPVAIFQGAGIVNAKTKINSGPKRGDYSLDIKIVSN